MDETSVYMPVLLSAHHSMLVNKSIAEIIHYPCIAI
jgi:hypothetical protein